MGGHSLLGLDPGFNGSWVGADSGSPLRELWEEAQCDGVGINIAGSLHCLPSLHETPMKLDLTNFNSLCG